MFENGFLGTNAPVYMDLVTIYFGLLPFLMGFAILMAVKKNFELHYKMQLSTYIVTIVMVLVFEIGVRLSGGFNAFMQESSADYTWLSIFLITHILIALASAILWSVLIYTSVKQYKSKEDGISKSHKKIGKIVYLGMTVTSITGIMIYYFLFAYTSNPV